MNHLDLLLNGVLMMVAGTVAACVAGRSAKGRHRAGGAPAPHPYFGDPDANGGGAP